VVYICVCVYMCVYVCICVYCGGKFTRGLAKPFRYSLFAPPACQENFTTISALLPQILEKSDPKNCHSGVILVPFWPENS
jgi:hypothetical protein